MIEITSIEDCHFPVDIPTVVAMGFFDGIHRAHRCLIQECQTRAQRLGGHAVVFTFQNHPSSVLTPDQPIPLLTPYPLKRMILESMGVDVTLAVPFDEKLCRTQARDFIEEVLRKRLHARELVVGFNFRFGHRREGSPDMLRRFIPEYFDDVAVIDQQFQDEIPISSTNLRHAIGLGNLTGASAILGRPYLIAGQVIQGAMRGRTLGFPTANLDTDHQLLPLRGVYGVQVRIGSLSAEPRWGVMNIGSIPTFTDQTQRTVEIHLLDFSGDLYGQYLLVDVLQFIRGEQKFFGPDALIHQIQKDIQIFHTFLFNPKTGL